MTKKSRHMQSVTPLTGPARILVVDDNDHIRMLLRHVLQHAEFDVEEARNGSEGLALLLDARFDVVITDIDMPIKDGITMAEDAWRHSPDVPFIVHSASVDEYADRVERQSERNICSILRKPASLQAIIEKVQQAIRRGPSRRHACAVPHTAAAG